MKLWIYLSLAVSLVLALLLPFLFGQVMLGALAKLHLSPTAALSVLMAMLIGSFVNISIARRGAARSPHYRVLSSAGFGMPQRNGAAQPSLLAVNLGGCVIPLALVIYELSLLADFGPSAVFAVIAATGWNIVVCYALARPAPGIGIFMPGLIPPLMAAGSAYLLAPDFAAPVAFIAGTIGPLVGADILHLPELDDSMGIASIGGAGTFDGIVLSGLLAALLA